jgi:predicted negative regulator of RcsB-dependent stress response
LRSTERHQLKQDKFASTTAETYSWALEHQKQVIIATVAAVVALAIVLGGYLYYQHQNQQAAVELNQAMRTYTAPIRPANMPAQPGEESYTSVAERANASRPKFQTVADAYPHTDAGKMALYMVGVTEVEAANNSAGEATLQKAANAGSKDLASLANLTLANLYASTGREQQAIDIFKKLIDKPTNTVTQSTARMALAQVYATKDPAKARELYEQIKKDDPNSAASTLANNRLEALK